MGMRTRSIVNGTVVWFGSIGIDENGNSIKSSNFSEKQQGVADSLTQRLSVIKGELWYNVNHGVPLLEKLQRKQLLDASIVTIVNSHPDVKEILSFSSKIVNGSYSFDMTILSIYGEINVNM